MVRSTSRPATVSGSIVIPIWRAAAAMMVRCSSSGVPPVSTRPIAAFSRGAKIFDANRKRPSFLGPSSRFRGTQKKSRPPVSARLISRRQTESSIQRRIAPSSSARFGRSVELIMASIFRTSVTARRRAVRKSPVLRLRTSSPEKPKASRRLGHFHRKNHGRGVEDMKARF